MTTPSIGWQFEAAQSIGVLLCSATFSSNAPPIWAMMAYTPKVVTSSHK